MVEYESKEKFIYFSFVKNENRLSIALMDLVKFLVVIDGDGNM